MSDKTLFEGWAGKNGLYVEVGWLSDGTSSIVCEGVDLVQFFPVPDSLEKSQVAMRLLIAAPALFQWVKIALSLGGPEDIAQVCNWIEGATEEVPERVRETLGGVLDGPTRIQIAELMEEIQEAVKLHNKAMKMAGEYVDLHGTHESVRARFNAGKGLVEMIDPEDESVLGDCLPRQARREVAFLLEEAFEEVEAAIDHLEAARRQADEEEDLTWLHSSPRDKSHEETLLENVSREIHQFLERPRYKSSK